MIRFFEKHPIISICLIVSVMLLPNLESLTVSIMEARNFITAREMITDNHWLLTTMNGEARYEKPPLPTWLTALSGFIFGVKSLFGLRLPAVLMVMVLGCFMFLFSNKLLKNKAHSLINALIAITSFYIIGIVIEAPWDIFTHSFMLIAIYHLFQLFEKEKTYWQHTILAGVFMGFSFLSKGPISFYALLLPFLFAYGLTFKFTDLKAKTFSIFSVLIIASIIGLWWYVFIRFEDPETFATIASKETGNWSSYNLRPIYYYWSFFTQSGLWTIPAFISLLYPYLKTRVSNRKVYTLSFLWTLIAVVLLSIIPEKKSRYLMPVLIPLAINTGFYIEYLIREFKTLKAKRETIPVYFNFGLIAFIGIAFPIISYIFLKDKVSDYWIPYLLSSIILVSIGIFILFYLKKKQIKTVFYLCILFFASLLFVGLPLSKAVMNNTEAISELKKLKFSQNLNMYGLRSLTPEVIFYYGEKVPSIKLNDSVFVLPKEDEFAVLATTINKEDMAYLKDLYTIKQLKSFDINASQPETRAYKTRLIAQYYVLSKRNKKIAR